MRTLASLLAVAAIAAFGLAGPAHADKWADAVESDSNVTNAGDATGANDSTFAVLGDAGSMILKFTDNTCLASGGNDVRIFDAEDGNDELYGVTTGLEGQSLASAGNHTETGSTEIDVTSAFTRIGLTDASAAGGDGAEFDAVECLNNLAFGTAHINKTNTGDTSIVINSKNGADAQQFFSFTITITNPDGADLSSFTFHDTVPGEFDVTSVVADNTNSTTLAGCTSVVAAEHKPGKKLSPDKITWDVDLAAGESCDIDVNVETSQKTPFIMTKKVNFAPTEGPIGGVVLNEGVEVSDADGDTILIDDSSLVLTCVDPPADPD